MKAVTSILVALLLSSCGPPQESTTHPILVVWSSNPHSSPFEVHTPELVIYDDGSLIARFTDTQVGLGYFKGSLPQHNRSVLMREATAYFGAEEYLEYFDQVRGNDHNTTVIELHAGTKVASTGLYGVGLFSVVDLGDALDFQPEVTGLPLALCRLLMQLYFTKRLATEPWTDIVWDKNGVPLIPHINTPSLNEKKANKAPEPTTTSVTSPAAQEPRQP